MLFDVSQPGFGTLFQIKRSKAPVDHLAARISDFVEYGRDLQIDHALNQPGEKDHADHEQRSDQQRGISWNFAVSISIDPRKGEERKNKCKRIDPDRMIKRAIADKPAHQTG